MSYVNTIQTQSNTYTYDQLQAMMANGTIDSSTVQNVSVFNQSADPSACTDGKDDGKLGFFETIGSAISGAVKGVVNGVKGLFCDENGNFSLGQTLKSAVTAAACFIPVVGPVIGGALCATGVVKGAVGIAQGVSAAASATTDAEAKAAIESIGGNALSTGLSVAGVKASVGAIAGTAKTLTGTSAFSSAKGIVGKAKGLATDIAGSAQSYYGSSWSSATTLTGKIGAVGKQAAKGTARNIMNTGELIKNKVDEKTANVKSKFSKNKSGETAGKTETATPADTKGLKQEIKSNYTRVKELPKDAVKSANGKTATVTDASGNKTTYHYSETNKCWMTKKQPGTIQQKIDGYKSDFSDFVANNKGKGITFASPKAAGLAVAANQTGDAAQDITESIAYQSTPMATVNTQTGREYYLEDYSIMSEDEVNQAYSDIMAQSQEIQL